MAARSLDQADARGSSWIHAVLLALVAAITCGCSSPTPPPPTCVQGLDLTCTPLYAPTFEEVYARTLHPTCAQSGASCHSAEGAKGGLIFDDPDETYALLLGTSGSKAQVIAGDAACSLLIARTESTSKSAQMPPGSPLPAAERCALVQWIENGAKR